MLRFLKRTIGLIVFLLIIILFAPEVKAATFSGGDGSEANPYQITTKQQLDAVRNYPNANFILMNDIVFEESDFKEGGDFYNYEGTYTIQEYPNEVTKEKCGWIPIKEFNGIFDGNNHLIKGLVYSSLNNYRGGLFEINNGTIKNLGISECDYSAGANDYLYMGGIAVYNYGSIIDCVVSGTITYYGNADVGGICYQNEGELIRCINTAKIGVTSYIPNGDWPRNVGGICVTNKGTIDTCMNLGMIYGTEEDAIGGICKYNASTGIVKNCTNYGAFVDRHLTVYVAGLIRSDGGKTTNCYNVLNSATGGIYKYENYVATETYQGYTNVLLKDRSKYEMPVLNNYFYDTYIEQALNSFNTDSYYLKASGYTYKSIKVEWPVDKTGAVDGYLLFRQDMQIDDIEDTSMQDTIVSYREIADIKGENTSFYIDKTELEANSRLHYFYKICPYYETNGVVVYGMYGGWTSSTVVDTNSEVIKDDCFAPVLHEVEILDQETYTPGALRVKVVAEDYENEIATISIFGETITVNKQKLDDVICIPISSNRTHATYNLDKVRLTDTEGNWVDVNANYYDNSTFTIKKEFDIEFTGVLSNKNVVTQLKEMEEGKTVALTINSASGGILKKELLDAIKGQDKTLIVYCDDEKSCQWIFYGKEIDGTTKDLDLNEEYNIISGKEYGVSGDILKLDYADNGTLPGKINFRIKTDYIAALYKQTGKLYLYHDQGKKIVAEDTECTVIRDGSSTWCYIDLSHNSTFFLSGKKLKQPISKQTISLSATSFNYNGKERKPTVEISGLEKDTDYKVTYSNNVNAGTAKVTIKGIGKYAGTVTKTFKIKQRAISKVTLSKTEYSYNGSVKKPSVTVRNSSGTKLSASSYTVTYASGRKNVGTYKVTVKGKGNYTGTLTATFKIKPKATTVKSLTAGGRNFTVKWNKVSSQASGYQIQYATNSKFSNAKKITVSSASTVSKKISSLTAGTKYYVRVRTYKTVGDTKYYSGWSSAKTVIPKPMSTTIKSVTAGTKKMTVKWNKVTSQVTGYEIQYATSSSFNSPTTVKVSKASTVSKTITGLKKGKKYYVRVRTYRTVNGKTYYSSWSTSKSTTVK